MLDLDILEGADPGVEFQGAVHTDMESDPITNLDHTRNPTLPLLTTMPIMSIDA